MRSWSLAPLGVLALLLLPLVPTASAHGGGHEEGPTSPTTSTPEPAAPTAVDGYTGPGREPYLNYFQGVWVYGRFSASPIDHQHPRGMRGSGDWLVWEDAGVSDIFVYNIPAGSGFYVTRDDNIQREPDIDGNVVVWEEYRPGRTAAVYAYFLDTGETRLLSKTPGNNRNPSLRGTLVAWENDADRSRDVWAYDLDNTTEFPIALGPERQSDPVVLGGRVYFREYRFNVWDVFAVDAETGEREQITADVNIQTPPFTNGDDVLFLSQYYGAWQLDRYDPQSGRVKRTPLSFQDATPTPASGENLLQSARDGVSRQLVARNLTSGASRHVSGNFILTSEPWLEGHTAYLAVSTRNGTSLVELDISPFAFVEKPELTITSPRSGARWTSLANIQGVLKLPGDWAQPTTFTYRIDDQAPVAIPVTGRFRFLIDAADQDPGRHQVVVRATFREGPPVEASILLLVPAAVDKGIDIRELGELYHTQRVMYTMRQYVLDNPASYLLVPLVLVLLVLLVLRLWLVLGPRRRRKVEVEYVAPDEAV